MMMTRYPNCIVNAITPNFHTNIIYSKGTLSVTLSRLDRGSDLEEIYNGI